MIVNVILFFRCLWFWMFMLIPVLGVIGIIDCFFVREWGWIIGEAFVITGFQCWVMIILGLIFRLRSLSFFFICWKLSTSFLTSFCLILRVSEGKRPLRLAYMLWRQQSRHSLIIEQLFLFFPNLILFTLYY